MWELEVTRGENALIGVPLDKTPFRIGQAVTNDLSLPDPSIPRHQCLLLIEQKRILLQDVSGHGTAVDGKRCRTAELTAGSRLDFPSLSMIVRERVDGRDDPGVPGAVATDVLDSQRAATTTLVLSGEINGQATRFSLQAQVTSIGALAGNDLVLSDSYVSGFHCRIYRKQDAWFITDLDSTNGTSVNNVMVQEARLDIGAVLTLGRFRFQVEEESAEPRPQLEMIWSVDPVMKPVFEMLKRAAPSDEPVLISGESGTGKELAARAIHALSRRAGGPLVCINCSAIARDLVESELFGHEKGAFTGAQIRRRGLMEEAHLGTLFLDEIGELSLAAQAKLLRALENGEIRPVGSDATKTVDVRVVAATHRSLSHMVKNKIFREDLYYRIFVLEISLPPLRRRPEDIPFLAKRFLEMATRHTGPRALSARALERLQQYRFPGNVRELRHLIIRAAILCPEEVIGDEQLLFAPPTMADIVAESRVYRKGMTLAEIESDAIRQALAVCGGNRREAAKQLAMARSTLIAKMEKYDLRARESDVTATDHLAQPLKNP